PDRQFVKWDGQSKYPKDDHFDVIFSKLTLHFIDDLSLFVKVSKDILLEGGSIVMSVPHPVRILKSVNGNYAPSTVFDGIIADSDLHVQMIHRTVGEYIRPFLEQGFVLTGIDEPLVTQEQVQKYTAS